jgi:hypothetical protein
MRKARGTLVDVLLFVVAVVVITAGVAYLSPDVRRQLGDLAARDRSSHVAMITVTAASVTRPVVETFHQYWMTNPWMVGFAIVACVMFLFMLKV